MLAHTVTCPNCRAELRLKTPPSAAARGANCPQCRGFVPFDYPHDRVEPAEDTAASAAGDRPTLDAPTRPTPADEPPAHPLPNLAPPQRPDEIGRLGPYRVLGELGRGGMGVVYHAEDPQLLRAVALKVMFPLLAAKPTDKARFMREARAQAQVEHDHVAQIYQVDEDGGVPFLAMPLLRGLSLSDALKANPQVPLPSAVRIAREVADGLTAAHEKGLIHRDIKPGNVWLEGKHLRVKILDFGLARPITSAANDSATEITHLGAVVGTPAYMSPEQGRGEPLDARTDLFSLGVVLYQMTAGRHPFRGNTGMALLIAVATEHPRPPSAFNRDVPPALDALTMELLEKNRDARPTSAEEVAARLRDIETLLNSVPRVVATPVGRRPINAPSDPWQNIDDTEESAGERAAPKPPPRSPAGRWALLFAALVLFGLVAAALSYFGTRPTGGTVAVEFADEATAERFRRSAQLVLAGGGREYIFTDTTSRRLPAGKYVARVTGDAELMPSYAEHTVTNGGQIKVKVVLREKDDDDNRDKDKGKKKKPPTTDPDRRAAEWALDCGGRVLVWVGDGAPPRLDPPDAFSFADWDKYRREGEVEVVSETDLPEGRFVVTRIDLHPVGRRVTADGIQALRGLKHLTFLDLFEAQISDDALAALSDMTELRVLTLQRAWVSDLGLKHLSGLPNLMYLNLSDRPITDDGLRHLSGLKQLRWLVLNYNGVRGPGVAHLRELPELRHLEFHLGNLTPDGLKQIAALPHLTELNLDGSNVQNEWLRPLAEAKSLRTLNLTNTKISDTGLLIAVGGGQLTRVAAQRTNVSGAGVKQAKEASPKTRIE